MKVTAICLIMSGCCASTIQRSCDPMPKWKVYVLEVRPMTTPSSLVDSIAKAMEGVTPGPWHAAPGTTTGQIVVAPNTTKAKRRVAAIGGPDRDTNAAYIAACSPDRMREVLALARKADAMEREIAELREALSPFAAVARVYDGTAVEDSDPVLSTDGPRLVAGDLRRARTLLNGGSDAQG